jgi:hypothetical protein
MQSSVSCGFLSALLTLGCGGESTVKPNGSQSNIGEDTNIEDSTAETDSDDDHAGPDDDQDTDTAPAEPLCDGEFISSEGVEEMLTLTALTNNETVYTTFERIDGIATLFEDCGDPWGMFPTTYRHITNRIIEAIEDQEIEDSEWGEQIVLDFASRYFANLEAALTNGELSYGWEHYYYLADNPDVSRTRAVLVAMVAHLTLDLPYALWAIETTDDHGEDYFVLGELMIEITPNFIEDLRFYYDTDAEDILNGFFLGDWVDGAYGEDTTITLSYQTIRTKSWNNWRLLNSGWGWVADSEIYTSFWAIDGVLATLDATGTI